MMLLLHQLLQVTRFRLAMKLDCLTILSISSRLSLEAMHPFTHMI